MFVLHSYTDCRCQVKISFYIIWNVSKSAIFSLFNALGLDPNDQNLSVVPRPDQQEEQNDGNDGSEEHSDGEAGVNGDDAADAFANLTGRQKKLFELRMKMVIFVCVKEQCG